MKTFIFALLLTLLLAGCAHNVVMSDCSQAKDRPEWVCTAPWWYK